MEELALGWTAISDIRRVLIRMATYYTAYAIDYFYFILIATAKDSVVFMVPDSGLSV